MRLIAKLTLALMALTAPLPASAGSDDALNYGDVRLLAGWPMSNGHHMMAVSIQLNPGWKTYWRAPGESGIPPRFDWSGSQNLATTEVHWPRPDVFETFGLQTVGYHHTVVIPVEIAPRDSTKPIDLSLQFSFGACSDICVPARGDWTTELTLDAPNMASDENRAILAALKTEPVVATAKHVRSVSCSIRPDGNGFRLSAEVELAAPAPASTVALIESGNPDLWVGAGVTSVSGRSLRAVAQMENYGTGGLVVDRSALRLTLLGDGLALDIRGCPAS